VNTYLNDAKSADYTIERRTMYALISIAESLEKLAEPAPLPTIHQHITNPELKVDGRSEADAYRHALDVLSKLDAPKPNNAAASGMSFEDTEDAYRTGWIGGVFASYALDTRELQRLASEAEEAGK